MHYIVKFISWIIIKLINFYDIFLIFDQILMDNHQLVMILILYFKKQEK